MAAKTANVYARIAPDVKEQAEDILEALGIPASTAINMFYRQIILQHGLPFAVEIPAPLCIEDLTPSQLDVELEKGYADVQSGRTKPVNEAFAKIRGTYNI